MAGNNPVTIEVLEILDAIDRRGSFAKAAEELNKATSAISYAVQKLEEQLGLAIFQRQGRRSVLTPAGKLLLEEGRKILSSTRRLADMTREVATGWEPRIRIAVEFLQPYPVLFGVIATFLQEHSSIEIDISECVLNGGWEALEQDRADLIVGVPGPVPRQMGYRAISLGLNDLVPVIASCHRYASYADNTDKLAELLPDIRRIVNHDTSIAAIARSAGLSNFGDKLYVQNIDQKVAAIVAGIGIGHLPRVRAQQYLDNGALVELSLGDSPANENFLAWKISNKGMGLKALSKLLAAAQWQ